MMRPHTFLPLLALAATCALGLSQDASRKLRFLAWDTATSRQSFTFHGGKRLVTLDDLHTLKRTEEYRWKGGGPLLMTLDGMKPSAETPPENLVSIPFPGQVKQALVLLIPDKTSKSGYRGLVLDDSMDRFPWGTYRFINATGVPLVCRLGPAAPVLLPKKLKTVDISPAGKRRNLPIGVAAQVQPEKWLFTSIWEHRPDFRRIVIIARSDDARSGPITLKVVPERKSEHATLRSE